MLVNYTISYVKAPIKSHSSCVVRSTIWQEVWPVSNAHAYTPGTQSSKSDSGTFSIHEIFKIKHTRHTSGLLKKKVFPILYAMRLT